MASIDSNVFTMNIEVHPHLLPMDTVFIHGNLASNTWWQPSLEIWKNESKPSFEGRLILGEWRGCGKSARATSESDLEMKTLAQDYVHMLQKLGVKKACLVGHSTGGLIALMAMLESPELFDRAVLLDPVAATGVQFGPEMFDAFTAMSKDRAMCEAVMGGTIHGNNPAHPLFKRIVDDAFSVGALNWHGIPKALAKVNILDDLSRVNQPVLVMHGEHDTVLPMEGSVVMANKLPKGKFIELKGQGHSTNFENPKLFVQHVNDFLFNRP